MVKRILMTASNTLSGFTLICSIIFTDIGMHVQLIQFSHIEALVLACCKCTSFSLLAMVEWAGKSGSQAYTCRRGQNTGTKNIIFIKSFNSFFFYSLSSDNDGTLTIKRNGKWHREQNKQNSSPGVDISRYTCGICPSNVCSPPCNTVTTSNCLRC